MKKIVVLFFAISLTSNFGYQSDVHPYISKQAFYLLAHYFPLIVNSELASQIGNINNFGGGPWQTGLITTGSYREDLEDVVWRMGPEDTWFLPNLLGTLFSSSPTATSTHFWIADNGDGAQTPGVGWPGATYPNALEKARKYLYGDWKILYLASGSSYIKEYTYNSLFELAKTGQIIQTGYYTVYPADYTSITPEIVTLSNTTRKYFVYEILGRILHLLQDMSVPAHVHGDSHADLSQATFLPCFGMDWCDDHDTYENWVDLQEANNWNWTDASVAGGLLNYQSVDDPLRYLFYSATQIADIFSSDDFSGNINLPNGQYDIINEYYSNLNYQVIPKEQVGLTASTNLVYSIRACATFLLWFAIETNMIKTLTATTNTNGNTYFSVRNPARSISSTSEYVVYLAPYKKDFEGTLVVDLNASYDPIYAFNGWQKRDKNNIIIGSNFTNEWLNASADATATFVGMYLPFVTLTLSPILLEGQSGSATYQNLTTGESGYQFQFPATYSTSIKAIAPEGYVFINWSDGHLENPRFFNISSNSSGLYAIFKKSNVSNYQNAYSNNSQRKFVRTYQGYLHNVYESMGKVWYEMSTDGGSTWNIMNGGKPLSTNDGKNPSIEPLGDFSVAIVFQENDGYGGYNIRVNIYNYINDTLADSEIANEGVTWDNYTNNANPVISFTTKDFNRFIVIWQSADFGPFAPGGLYYRYGNLDGFLFDLEWFEDYGILVPGTGASSIHPTIASLNTAHPLIFHLAWEENNNIKYRKLTDNGSSIGFGSILTPSNGNGLYNSKPNIAIYSLQKLPVFTWLVYNPITYLTQVQLRILYGTVKQSWSQFWTYGGGGDVNSANINNNTDGKFVLAWGSDYNDRYITSYSTINIYNLTTQGDVQVSNAGASMGDMKIMSFDSYNSPYDFTPNAVTQGVYKGSGDEIVSKGFILTRDDNVYAFDFGGIEVDGKRILFVDFFEEETDSLKRFSVETESFDLTDNSDFNFKMDYFSSASQLNQKPVKFKLQLIEANTGEVLSTLKEETGLSSSYNNLGYAVNLNGIGNKEVKLRLVFKDKDINSEIYTKVISDSVELKKENYQQISYNGEEVITDYSLSQNYPNPFNPSTIINYQIPNDGFVILKIYDILGKEVKTLLNENKTTGRYEIKFDATDLASGIYIYQLKVNDFFSSKKMLLIK